MQFCGGNNCGVIVGETSLTISWHESPRSSVFSFLFLFLVPSSALGAQDWSRFTVQNTTPESEDGLRIVVIVADRSEERRVGKECRN